MITGTFASTPAVLDPATLISEHIVRVTITPEAAKHLLDTYNHGNREIVKRAVRLYTKDMKAGRWGWQVCEPLKFATTGRLLDGQHRLQAVVASNTAQTFWLQGGLPDSAQANMDNGRSRTVSDFSEVGRMQAAITRMMVRGLRNGHSDTTRHEELAIIATHAPAVAFAQECFANVPRHLQTFKRACVLAVWARAFYTRDHDALRLCAMDLVNGGLQIQRLRDFLIATPGAGGNSQAVVYRKVSRAVDTYLRGGTVVRLVDAAEELFPLPSEGEAE